MTHALIAAKSGWGKNWISQWWVEDNLDEFEYLVVLDRLDEFRGLVKAGFANWGIIGPDEVTAPPSAWKEIIEQNKRIVLARHNIDGEDWMDAAASVSQAAMALDGGVLVVIDEAHKVAPQRGSYPDAIQSLATEGRGHVATLWVTQRLAKLDETPVGEMMVFLLGGFRSDADLEKLRGNVGYPVDIHAISNGQIRQLPEELHADDAGPVALRRFKEGSQVVGSEWVYSNDDGLLKRINSRNLSMESEHYGRESLDLSVPG